MKFLFSILVLLASIAGQSQNATVGKNTDNQEEKLVLVKPDVGSSQAIAMGQAKETTVNAEHVSSKKAEDKKAKSYRGGSSTKRVIIIAAIAIAAVAIIIYVVASASVTKN